MRYKGIRSHCLCFQLLVMQKNTACAREVFWFRGRVSGQITYILLCKWTFIPFLISINRFFMPNYRKSRRASVVTVCTFIVKKSSSNGYFKWRWQLTFKIILNRVKMIKCTSSWIQLKSILFFSKFIKIESVFCFCFLIKISFIHSSLFVHTINPIERSADFSFLHL